MTTAEKIYTLDEFNALPREMTQGCELLDGPHRQEARVGRGGKRHDTGTCFCIRKWCG